MCKFDYDNRLQEIDYKIQALEKSLKIMREDIRAKYQKVLILMDKLSEYNYLDIINRTIDIDYQMCHKIMTDFYDTMDSIRKADYMIFALKDEKKHLLELKCYGLYDNDFVIDEWNW